MVILAVDFGEVRTGLACCDKDEYLASPAGVITQKNMEKLLDRVSEKAKQLKAREIVVGLPKNMDGSEGLRADICRDFACRLAEKTDLNVVLRDERLTTLSAHKYLSMNDVRGKKRKNIVDAVSAALILEDYLRYRKNTCKK